MAETALGAVVVGTAVVATLATAFATTQWFPGNSPAVTTFIAFAGGLLVGGLIFNLDRFMLLRMSRQSSDRRTLLFAAPRVFVAVTLGFFVAQPLVLEMNRSDVQMRAERNRRAEVRDLAKENANLAKDVSTKRAEVSKLANDAAGAGQYGYVTDPRYAAALKQANSAKKALGKAADCAQAEASGSKLAGCGNSGKSGIGPIAAAKLAAANAQAKNASELQAQFDGVAGGLQQAAKTASESTRASATASLKSEQQNLKDMEDELRAAQQNQHDLAKQKIGAPGLEKALWQLAAENPAVALNWILLTFVLLALDAGPVAFKALSLTGTKSPYEEVQDDIRDGVRAEQEANRSIRKTKSQARVARAEKKVKKRSESTDWEDDQVENLFKNSRKRWIDGAEAAWKEYDKAAMPPYFDRQFRRFHDDDLGTAGGSSGSNGNGSGPTRATAGGRGGANRNGSGPDRHANGGRSGARGNGSGRARGTAGDPTNPFNDGTDPATRPGTTVTPSNPADADTA